MILSISLAHRTEKLGTKARKKQENEFWSWSAKKRVRPQQRSQRPPFQTFVEAAIWQFRFFQYFSIAALVGQTKTRLEASNTPEVAHPATRILSTPTTTTMTTTSSTAAAAVTEPCANVLKKEGEKNISLKKIKYNKKKKREEGKHKNNEPFRCESRLMISSLQLALRLSNERWVSKRSLYLHVGEQYIYIYE